MARAGRQTLEGRGQILGWQEQVAEGRQRALVQEETALQFEVRDANRSASSTRDRFGQFEQNVRTEADTWVRRVRNTEDQMRQAEARGLEATTRRAETETLRREQRTQYELVERYKTALVGTREHVRAAE